jgi:ribosome-associated protein
MNRIFDSELIFRSSRSSGPGGQHVNKVNTKIELRFDIQGSELLSEDEKEILLEKLKNKVNNEGVLIIISQYSRSQIKNKANAVDKFYRLIEEALTPTKERKPTKQPRHIKEKRLEEKQKLSEKKSLRKPPQL